MFSDAGQAPNFDRSVGIRTGRKELSVGAVHCRGQAVVTTRERFREFACGRGDKIDGLGIAVRDGDFLPIRAEHHMACVLHREVVRAFPVVQIPQNRMISAGIIEARHPPAVRADRRSDNRERLLHFAGSRIKNLY